MNLIVEAFMFFYPIGLLSVFAYMLNKILNSDMYKETEKVNFAICGIKDLFPHRIKKKLKENKETDKKLAKKAYKIYKILLFLVCLYLMLWIIYLVWVVIDIFSLVETHESISIDQIPVIIGIKIVNILTIYWLFLTPIFENLSKMKTLAKFGYTVYDYCRKVYDNLSLEIISILSKFAERIVPFIFSYVFLRIYVLLSLSYIFYKEWEINLWNMLIALLLYQYIFLKRVCKIIIRCNIVKKFLSKKGILNIFNEKNTLYLKMKNTTYLVMILIYAKSIEINKSSFAIPAAIGILFLIDTYITEEKNIQKLVDENTDSTMK